MCVDSSLVRIPSWNGTPRFPNAMRDQGRFCSGVRGCSHWPSIGAALKSAVRMLAEVSTLALVSITTFGVNVASADSGTAAAVVPGGGYLESQTLLVSSSGNEVFTTHRLDPRYSYRAWVSGVLDVQEHVFFYGWVQEQADAEFVTENSNFTKRKGCLAFSTGATLIAEDRATHMYTYDLRGDGEKLSVRFRDTEMWLYSALNPPSTLVVSIQRGEPQPSRLWTYAPYASLLLIAGLTAVRLRRVRVRRESSRACFARPWVTFR